MPSSPEQVFSQRALFPRDHATVEAELSAGRVMARALAGATDGAGPRLALARAFCHRTLSAWWEVLAPDAPLRDGFAATPLEALPEPAASLAEQMGTRAGELPHDRAIYEIGLVYTAMLPDEWRSAHGVYYTPPVLAEWLLDRAEGAGVDWSTCRALDPACGGGAFLAPLSRRMARAIEAATPAVQLQNIAARLAGLELDPFAAWVSQVALDAALLPLCRRAGRPAPVVVTVCDALHSPAAGAFDLVVGNPPYGRVTLPPASRAQFERSLYGHANLYGLFTDLALQHAKSGGVIAYVTPTSFLAGGYFRNLRELLTRLAPPVSFDFVESRKGVFDSVLQETLLACYRKDGARTDGSAHTLTLGSGAVTRVERAGPFRVPEVGAAPWLVPRDPGQAALIERTGAMPDRLRSWGYTVSTGPLVWNRHKPQLRSTPGPGRLPLIWAESISTDGTFRFRAERRNHEPYFEVGAGDEWLVVRSPCVLLQRTTAKEQRRRLVAAELPRDLLRTHDGVVVENHLNMIRPLTGCTPRVKAAVLTALLNSEVLDRVFRCLSGSVAVSAYELEALPLPDPTDLSPLEALVAEGAEPNRIAAECRRLYGEAAK